MAGRKKGAINKRTRAKLAMSAGVYGLADQVLQVFIDALGSYDDNKRLDAAKHLAQYIWPRLQAVSGMAGGAPIKIIIAKEDAEA